MNKISLLEVKQALRDGRFRSSLPQELQPDMEKYLQNPGCACNTKFYRRILQECKKQLVAYFPGKEIEDVDEELLKLAENNWTVFSCHIGELENKLRKLPRGRKQIAVARWEDQVTVIVNDLEVLF